MSPEVQISLLALLFSFVAIAWNICRDILLDRQNLDVRVDIGEIKEDDRGISIFMPAGDEFDLKVSSGIAKPQTIMFQATNTGRRDIVVDRVEMLYTKKAIKGGKLPAWWIHFKGEENRLIKPYGTASVNTNRLDLIDDLRTGKIDSAYIADSRGKKWYLSKRKLKRLINKYTKATVK